MIKLCKINSNLSVERKENFRRVKIYINFGETSMLLCDVKKLDENFRVHVVNDENYVLVYSKCSMNNYIPVKIEAAYNIKDNYVVDLSNYKTRVLLEHMFVSKIMFDAATVLEFINNNRLGIATKEDVDDFVKYLTCGNNKITHLEIIEYILMMYPCLINYINISEKLLVSEYRKIVLDLGIGVFKFYAMPQIVDSSHVVDISEEIKKEEKVNVKKRVVNKARIKNSSL